MPFPYFMVWCSAHPTPEAFSSRFHFVEIQQENFFYDNIKTKTFKRKIIKSNGLFLNSKKVYTLIVNGPYYSD